MYVNIYNRKYKQEPWVILYRRLKRYCNNPNSLMYFQYGQRGVKFDFSSSIEIKYLWDRDDASNIKEPSLERKNESKGFNKDNCFFVDATEYYLERAKKYLL